ncbi:MAG: zf-HC2 domain-containing protein [Planctomycetota bacterium]
MKQNWSEENNPKSSCLYERDIPAYCQGELSPPAVRRIEEHFNHCAICRNELKETGALLAKMKSGLDESVRRNFAARILQKIPPEEWEESSGKTSAQPGRFVKIVLSAAGLLLIISSLWLIGRLNNKQDSNAPVLKPVNQFVQTDEKNYADSQEVIKSALNWLSQTQEPAGYWDTVKWGGQKKYEVGLTGLALFSFIAQSQKNQGNFNDGTTLQNGLAFLIQQQNRTGLFGPDFAGAMYNHGIATTVLLEYYSLNQEEKLRMPIQKALSYIKETQKPSGGWGYTADVRESPNTVISFWPLQALSLASKSRLGGTGPDWPGLKPSLERGFNWFRQTCDLKGKPGYHRPFEFPYGSETLMAVGAFNYFYNMENQFAIPDEASRSFREELYQEANQLTGGINYYGWYFLTYALYAENSPRARQKKDEIINTLINTQNQTAIYAGSWEPADRWGEIGGRVYATALAALTLEVESRAPRLLQ